MLPSAPPIQRQLEKTGYRRLVTYASAEQVLEQRPEENEPGCILLDVRLRGLSGPALHSRLIELHLTLSIVFLTGYADVSATVKVIKAGADDFLTKSVKSDELLRAMSRSSLAAAPSRLARAMRALSENLGASRQIGTAF